MAKWIKEEEDTEEDVAYDTARTARQRQTLRDREVTIQLAFLAAGIAIGAILTGFVVMTH
jgi:predicted metal-dependent hydrolase